MTNRTYIPIFLAMTALAVSGCATLTPQAQVNIQAICQAEGRAATQAMFPQDAERLAGMTYHDKEALTPEQREVWMGAMGPCIKREVRVALDANGQQQAAAAAGAAVGAVVGIVGGAALGAAAARPNTVIIVPARRCNFWRCW